MEPYKSHFQQVQSQLCYSYWGDGHWQPATEERLLYFLDPGGNKNPRDALLSKMARGETFQHRHQSGRFALKHNSCVDPVSVKRYGEGTVSCLPLYLPGEAWLPAYPSHDVAVNWITNLFLKEFLSLLWNSNQKGTLSCQSSRLFLLRALSMTLEHPQVCGSAQFHKI